MRNGMFYVGQTQEVKERLQRHANGIDSRQAKQLQEFLLLKRRSHEDRHRNKAGAPTQEMVSGKKARPHSRRL